MRHIKLNPNVSCVGNFYIYGTGLIAKRVAYHFNDAYTLKGYIETKPEKKDFLGKAVFFPDILLSDRDWDFCIIASAASSEIRGYLLGIGVPDKKIVCIWDEKNNISAIDDRLAFLRTVAEDLSDKGIKGSVAEVGVYKGSFSRHINAEFPDSKFYLFDTFDGFDQRDVDFDLAHGFDGGGIKKNNLAFDDIDYVLNRMPYRDRCVLKKGFFPETAQGIEDRFVFVSLDVDMYQPIYEGLRYFWPRMEVGGCIVVHDYASPHWPGVKQAVREFSDCEKAAFIPLSDLCGSAVFVKS